MTRILPDSARTSRVRVSWKDLVGPPEWLGRLSGRSLGADAFAGLTGAAIVLPQAVAFATIAGLPPHYGFYTAIVAALADSSWHAVTGPATAISAMVFSALSTGFRGIEGIRSDPLPAGAFTM